MNNIHHTPILTRQQCSALRGIAIIGIVLHNYCHWLGLAVKENEYTFTFANCRRLLAVTFSPDINYPVHLLSFFGHYGVPIFLFLSAYGLVLKYESADKPGAQSPSAWRFVRYHFLKLFKMMIVGYVAFTMVDAITPKPFHYTVADILSQLGMFNNLRPDPDHVIWPGPYWFFGLMLQTYIVYRLLLYRRGWLPAVLLVAACWAVQAVCDPEGDALNRLRYNFIGGIMPFVAGLFVARYGRDLGHNGSGGHELQLPAVVLDSALRMRRCGGTGQESADGRAHHTRLGGRHIGGHVCHAPHHTQDIHTHKPRRRRVCRTPVLHHIHHSTGMALPRPAQEDTESAPRQGGEVSKPHATSHTQRHIPPQWTEHTTTH